MKREREEKILAAACDICHWPYVYEDEISMQNEKCDYCQIDDLLQEERKELENLAVQITQIFVDELHKVPEAVAKAMTNRWKEANE